MQKVLAREATAPLTSEITGLAPLVRALNQSSIDSLHKGELLALPILFVMLLLIFGSPIAALDPGDQRAARHAHRHRACSASLGERVDIDALALNLVTMVGLALGVDYALLVVSRFREELADGASVADAAEEAAVARRADRAARRRRARRSAWAAACSSRRARCSSPPGSA